MWTGEEVRKQALSYTAARCTNGTAFRGKFGNI